MLRTQLASMYSRFAVGDWGWVVDDAVVNGRTESRAVSEFLRSAAQQPSGLVIEGEPGIGKTTLWLSAVEQAREQRIPGVLGAGRAGGDGAGLCGGGRPSPRH